MSLVISAEYNSSLATIFLAYYVPFASSLASSNNEIGGNYPKFS